MRRITRRIRIAAVTLMLAARTPLTASDTFVFALRGKLPQSLSPLDVYNTNELVIEGEIMEGLLEPDPKNPDGPPKPNLATYRRIDPTTYVFRLRRNVYFHPFKDHQHERLTARDVVGSLRRAIASNARLVDRLKNIESIEPISDDLVKIELKKPNDDLLAVLQTPIAHITSEHYFKSLGNDDETRNERFRHAPIGTGPYALRVPLTEDATEITIDRFNDYHDQKWVHASTTVPSATYRFYSDPQDILTGIHNGDVSMTTLPVTEFGDGIDVRGTGAFPQVTPPFLPILAINASKGALKDKMIRQLLNAAVDTHRFVSADSGVDQLPAGFHDYMLIPQRYLKQNGEETRRRLLADPVTRRRLDALRNTGKLVIMVPSRRDHFVDRILDSVIFDLQSNLGLEVVKDRQPVISDEVVKKLHPDFIYREWTPDTAQEHDDLSMLKPLFSLDSHNNLGLYKDPIIDHLFDRLQGINDAASKKQVYNEMEDRLADQAPLIWLPIVRQWALFLRKDYQAPFTRKSVRASTLLYFTSMLKDIRKRQP
jgi:ABC-type transport system substrate-binding protein